MSEYCGEFPRGFRSTEAFYDKLLGQEQVFTDNRVDPAGRVDSILSGNKVRAVLVKNVNASAPLPGSIVKWAAAGVGTTVDGNTGADEAGCGVVDPSLLTGPVQGEKFLIFVEGPVQVLGSAAISAGAKIKTAASGKVVTSTEAAVADLVGGCGQAIELGANNTLFRANVFFRL